MSKRHQLFALSVISLACVSTTFAAKAIDLRHQPVSALQTFSLAAGTNSQTGVKELNRHVDANQTTHIRFQQTFAGRPVWGTDAVMHVPHNSHALLAAPSAGTKMNGKIYQGLEADLSNTPAASLTDAQADKALQVAVNMHTEKTGIKKVDLTNAQKKLIVYVDKAGKAHYAYLVSFLSSNADTSMALPTYILDATTFVAYEQWNNLQTLENKTLGNVTLGGGDGGNPKMGELSYDGLKGDLLALNITRSGSKCTLENKDVTVIDDTYTSGPIGFHFTESFTCSKLDNQHNNVYWDGESDETNDGYSPANDAMYIGTVVHDMYNEWYQLPVLKDDKGQPLHLNMHVHSKELFHVEPMENAYFFPGTNEMYFGDGASMFYPLTSLGVGAHELSHGFTSQHSNLTYEKQSGGLNESFSDMAAQAGEFYAYGKNSWQIGPEIVKAPDTALRYMDEPTKDGKSIDNAKDYTDDLNVHYTSGVFNKAFYTLATTKGWDTRKAFDVMVKANMDYWTADTTFQDAACGAMSAAQDLNYDTAGVAHAMNAVGIDVKDCG